MGTGVKVKVNLKGIERKVTPMGLARAKEAVTNPDGYGHAPFYT